MNLPNKLTCLRMIMIPFFLFFLVVPEVLGINVSRIVGAILFLLTAFTDMLDGKIARKYNLETDFGKFMDPLADKMMVFGAMFGILVLTSADSELSREVASGLTVSSLFIRIFAFCAFIIVFRELAVTSMRLVVSNTDGIVIAANIFGKIKTVSQIIGITVIIIEPLISDLLIASYFFLAVMVITTLVSGFSYFKAYWPHINSNK